MTTTTTPELKINGKDARQEWGVIADTSLIASLLAPPAVKDPIQSSSRLEHGTRTIIPSGSVKFAKREFSLEIGMTAPDFTTFVARYQSFLAELTAGWVHIETAYLPDIAFNCRYVSCTQFSNYNGRIAKFIIKFEEPNPNDRVWTQS